MIRLILVVILLINDSVQFNNSMYSWPEDIELNDKHNNATRTKRWSFFDEPSDPDYIPVSTCRQLRLPCTDLGDNEQDDFLMRKVKRNYANIVKIFSMDSEEQLAIEQYQQRDKGTIESIPLCAEKVVKIYPTGAKNINGKWKIILNTYEGKEQPVYAHYCTRSRGFCHRIRSRKYFCQQESSYVDLLALEKGRDDPHVDRFNFPSHCVCMERFFL